MASIKNLKKDIDYILGDVIDECLTKQTEDTKQTEAIVDEAFDCYNELIVKINEKNVENKKAHFKAIQVELEERLVKLLEKVNKL